MNQELKRVIDNTSNINTIAEIRDSLDPISVEWQCAEDKLRELLKAKYGEEKVFVIEASLLPEGIETGFTPAPENADEMKKYLNENGIFMYRYQVEFNSFYRQIIPYIVIKAGENKIFSVQRLQGDSRLVGNISIGVGGHIDFVDQAYTKDVIQAGMDRELNEEVSLGAANCGNITFGGFIYDNSNVVGRDHLGLVLVLTLVYDTISVKETDTLLGKLLTKGELGAKENYEKLENWSKIVYDNLLK